MNARSLIYCTYSFVVFLSCYSTEGKLILPSVFILVTFMFQQITLVESVAEGTADSVLTVNTESTTKPPPFKDPAFMVTDCSDVCEGVFLFANLLQMLCWHFSL